MQKPLPVSGERIDALTCSPTSPLAPGGPELACPKKAKITAVLVPLSSVCFLIPGQTSLRDHCSSHAIGKEREVQQGYPTPICTAGWGSLCGIPALTEQERLGPPRLPTTFNLFVFLSPPTLGPHEASWTAFTGKFPPLPGDILLGLDALSSHPPAHPQNFLHTWWEKVLPSVPSTLSLLMWPFVLQTWHFRIIVTWDHVSRSSLLCPRYLEHCLGHYELEAYWNYIC